MDYAGMAKKLLMDETEKLVLSRQGDNSFSVIKRSYNFIQDWWEFKKLKKAIIRSYVHGNIITLTMGEKTFIILAMKSEYSTDLQKSYRATKQIVELLGEEC